MYTTDGMEAVKERLVISTDHITTNRADQWLLIHSAVVHGCYDYKPLGY